MLTWAMTYLIKNEITVNGIFLFFAMGFDLILCWLIIDIWKEKKNISRDDIISKQDIEVLREQRALLEGEFNKLKYSQSEIYAEIEGIKNLYIWEYQKHNTSPDSIWLEINKAIEGEEFIDDIIQRINKKQLKK